MLAIIKRTQILLLFAVSLCTYWYIYVDFSLFSVGYLLQDVPLCMVHIFINTAFYLYLFYQH